MSGSPEQEGNLSIRIELTRENEVRHIEIKSDASVIDLVKSMDLPVDGVLVLSGNVPIPLDLTVREAGNHLKLINVASGG